MADSQGAGKPVPKQSAAQEISYIGARLREKSTYAGLSVVISLALPFLSKYVPALSGDDAAQIVNAISALGVAIGGIIAILLPERGNTRAPLPVPGSKGSAKAIIALWGVAGALTFLPPPAHAAMVRHARTVARNVPLPKPRPAQLGNLWDSVKPGKPTVPQVQQNPLLVLQQFTAADLQAALKDAQSQTPPDTTAASCYAALIPFVQSQVQNPLPQGAGVFQALQKARDAKAYLANIQSPTGPLAGLNQACAPLVLDVQNTLLTLGVAVGVIANPTTAPATLAGLPAAIAAFLNLPKL